MSASPAHAPHASAPLGWPAWLRRTVLFTILWWVLSGGSVQGWVVGVPFVLLATWLSLQLWTEYRLSLVGILRFLPWFRCW